MKILEVQDNSVPLPELIDAMMKGEEVIFSRNGEPVAKLEGLAQGHSGVDKKLQEAL